MIDLENAKNIFFNFVNSFDTKNEMIKRKIIHSYGVMDISKKIASSLNLELEDIELAELIGLLHDIGRFRQFDITKSYNDSNLDHAQAGVDILFKENMIKDFIPNIRIYDDIIKKAILYHNKFEIPKELNDKEKMFCQIVRDADKLDNFNVLLKNNLTSICKDKEYNDNISEDLLNALFNGKQIPSVRHKYFLDWFLNCLTYIYDFNYLVSYKIVEEENFINKLIDKALDLFPQKHDILENVRNYLNKYLQNKING